MNNKWKANEIRKHINKGKDGILVHAASYHDAMCKLSKFRQKYSPKYTYMCITKVYNTT